MLQRKLILYVGSLIGLLVLGAISAIALLHSALEDLIDAGGAVTTETTRLYELESTADGLVLELEHLDRQHAATPSALTLVIDDLEQQLRDLDEPLGASRARLDALRDDVEALADAPDDQRTAAALEAATAFRAEVSAQSRLIRDRNRQAFDRLVKKFRIGGLVAGLVSIVLLNVSIVVLLRAATMILRPVNELVEASQRLGREEFDCRVRVDRTDEFGELAVAYNSLAAQLQANEQRKIEVLHQVSRTMNHELNNAISTIEMQLALLDRRSGGNEDVAEPLKRIHRSLGRMSHTIEALKRVRRIVLTDYLSGVTMLDLERSVEEIPEGDVPAEAVKIKAP